MKPAAGWLSTAGYVTGWRLIRALPAPVAGRLFAAAADLAVRRDGRSVRQLRRNLQRVAGAAAGAAELDRLVRAGMRSYARYWLETFRLPSMDVGQVLAAVRTDGAEHVDQAMAAGRGAVFALPHSGNWDIAGLWLVRRGYPFSTVAERLKPESLFDRFVAYRESLGMRVLPLTGGPQPPTTVLAERLRAGEAVCLVADRDLSRNGVDVEFFGERTRMPAGPALLAATTGAALMPVHLYFDGDGWGQWIGPPIELGDGPLRDRVRRGTQALADAFEAGIARYPQDWHMLQRLWLADFDQAGSGQDGSGQDGSGPAGSDRNGGESAGDESAGDEPAATVGRP
ncbi:phosphatidylinositol mannoside acyltransferase [Jatrophihabitans sp.]|uniref:phosphatidylinositol mannoside acyltransferase n=1 Tax=Jatrophihabitans sp. TaxID=1932789 RepID=UPI002B8D5E39|nr:phosphatidylinositol mannoside acyltransferase [Jatrophihabitans sp.]